MASTNGKVTVKEEPEEPEVQSDPVEVPPGVVLDKLDSLLNSGRVMLHFSKAGGKLWGINGKLDGTWCSFRVEADGSCQFADETVWSTETPDEWADSEIEWLEKLGKKAVDFPSTAAAQPSALRPRECRRAVFTYYRAEHAKQKKAKAKAKAATGKAGVAKSPAPKVVAKQPMVKAVSKQPAAKAKVAAVAKAPAAPTQANSFPEFLAVTKSRLLKVGQKDKYVKFLSAVNAGKDHQVIVTKLTGYPDLIAQYWRIKATAEAQAATGKGLAGKPQQPKEPPPSSLLAAKAAGPARTDRPMQQALDADTEVLAPLRKVVDDAAVLLVKLVLGNRGARPSLRLAMLKYARSQATVGDAFREMFILRGPPGIGKSTHALDCVRREVGLVDDEEQAARFVHICSADDFLTKFKDGEEEYTFNQDQIELAYARNEARVQLAMELGISPLYVDNSHIQMWEMAPYARRAKDKEYEVNIVDPEDISDEWKDANALIQRSESREQKSKKVKSDVLEEIISAFEPLPEEGDKVENILAAERAGPRLVALPAESEQAAQEPDSAKPAPAAPASAPVAVPPPEKKAAAPEQPTQGAKRPGASFSFVAPTAKRPAPKAPQKQVEPASRAPSSTSLDTPSAVLLSTPGPGSTEARVASSLLSTLKRKPKPAAT